MTGTPTYNEDDPDLSSLVDFTVPVPLQPHMIVIGSGAVVTDTEQREYVDLEGGPGVVSVGHCHPKVVQAVRDQAGQLMQAPGYNFTPLMLTLARRLAKLTANRLRRSFFAEDDRQIGTDLQLQTYAQALEPKPLAWTRGGHYDVYRSEFITAASAAREWFVNWLHPSETRQSHTRPQPPT